MKQIPLPQALAWIIASLLIVPGGAFKLYKLALHQEKISQADYLCRIVQTGPQKEALKTPYLAELIRLSANRPLLASQFDPYLAEKRLRLSPVIKDATVKILKPDTVYIDYTVRQPLASLYDFDNVALDENGVPFPIVPFFTPKKLPEIYLEIKTFAWSEPIKGPKAELALELLKLMLAQSLHVKRVDVTQAFASSLGQREIVVILEENGYSKYLRLTPKSYAKELGNYLELRSALLPEPQVIDLRIPQLAFINSSNKNQN